MKLFKFLFFISMLVSLNSPARERTPDEMRQEALNVLISKHPQQRRAQTLFFNDLKELKRMDNLSIVGLEDFGFVVISHDDSFDAVIGYSFTPLTDTLPCGFEWWLETANESMRTLSSTTTRSMRVQRANSYPSSVEPLLTSKWSQKAPYNDKCKVVVKGKTYTCPTGCVATAFAQVLNYYKYPVHGVGSYSYTVPYTTWGDIEYSANFENSTYDWNNMLDDYSQGYTTVQADAVATLMHDCGIAVAMEYGTKSSFAFLGSIETAVKRYFSFNYAKYSDRYNYSNDEWLDILYDELAHGRPILYDGFKKGYSSGHAFVVDGYDGSGLFHINWGWGGKQDGYFDINVLNGYSIGQEMVTIWKEEVNDTRSEQTMELTALPIMTYGDAVYLLPDKTTEGLKLTWNIDDRAVASINGYQLTILKAGSTTITAYQEGNDSYKPFTKEFLLTINKGNLKIIANNATKIEGMETPELSVTYEGFKYNDNALSLTTKPTVTTTATMNSPVGTYPILVSGALSDNYTITYVNGILTILAKEDNEPTSYCVVIEIDGGEQTEYVLTENPKLSFDGKTIILTTTKVRIEYSATDIIKVALKDISTTDIEVVEERQRQVQLLNDEVSMNGLVAHETVQLYNMSGILLSTWQASSNGDLTITLSDLQRGIYIIKANHQSFKVTRK